MDLDVDLAWDACMGPGSCLCVGLRVFDLDDDPAVSIPRC
jgi:ferredoxin